MSTMSMATDWRMAAGTLSGFNVSVESRTVTLPAAYALRSSSLTSKMLCHSLHRKAVYSRPNRCSKFLRESSFVQLDGWKSQIINVSPTLHYSPNIGSIKATSDPAEGEETQPSSQVLAEKQAVLLEQNRKLLAMQRELLGQIDERKKLHVALVGSVPQASIPEQQQAKGVNPPKESQPPTPSPSSNLADGTSSTSRPLTTAWPSKRPPRSQSSSVSVPQRPLPSTPAPAPAPIPPSEGSSDEDAANAAPEEPSAPLAGPNVMNVVLVAAECAPWSKTGGLGDVVGALPKALARRGHRVMVVAPRYSNYEEAWDSNVRKYFQVAGQDMEVGYFHGFVDGVDFVFIDSPVFHHTAGNIYGGSREEVQFRMILLCKAAIEAPWHVPCGGVPYGDANLVFVANDWHTSLLPVYLQAYYRDNGLMEYARSVLVIHNMAHQGRGPLADFARLGLPDHYMDKFRLYDPIGGEHLNVFMAGLITAHRIVAVSHGYAWECQTPDGGWGLDGVIRDHSYKLRGVVNGIDTHEWNPLSDVFLRDEGYAHYGIQSLNDKEKCKAALQRELGLPVRPEVPLLGFIGRLDFQKGVDILGDALPWMMDQDLQLVLLGSGRADLEDMLRGFESRHYDKVRSWVGFSVKMAHRITAGVDIQLMPSRFEPCGLNQLYAMRYGTVPVVHAVGGLRDTVHQFDPYSNSGLGWTFDRADAGGLIHALGNAMYTYRDFKDSWRDLQLRGMSQDLSWDNAAQQYEEVLLAAKYTW